MKDKLEQGTDKIGKQGTDKTNKKGLGKTMKKTGGKNTKKITKIIMFILTVVAFVFVMSGVNRPHMSPFTNTVDFENVLTGACSDNGGIAIDNQGQRILFIDENSKLVKVVDLSKSGSDVNYVKNAVVSGDKVYAIGYSCINDGINISHESIVCYDLGGKYIGEVYRENYKAGSYVVENRFKSITTSDDRIILTKANDNKITALSLNLKGKDRKKIAEQLVPEHIMKGMYSGSDNAFAVLGRSGQCYWIDCTTSSYYEKSLQDCIVAIADMSDSSFADSKIMSEIRNGNTQVSISIAYDTDGIVEYLILTDSDNNIVELINYTEKINKELQDIKYGTAFQIYTIAYWLSVVWIIAAAIVAFVWLAKNKFNGKGAGICVVIALIIITSVFYTVNQALSIRDRYRQIIKTDAKLIATTISELHGDELAGIGDMTDDKVDEIQKVLYEVFKAYGEDSSYYCGLYSVESDGSVYTFADSRNILPCGIRIGATDEMQKIIRKSSGEDVYIMEDSVSADLYSFQRITNSNGDIVAVVEIGCKINNLIDEIVTDSITTFVNLLAIFILIYVCYFSFSTFKEDIKRFKSRDKSDKINKKVDLAGIFAFVYFVASSIDAAIVVYVAESLCQNISAGKQAMLISLPLAAASGGCWIGNFLYNSLSQKLGERTLAVVSSAIGIASLLLSIIAVKNANIYIYVAAKFLFGFAYWGVIALLSDSLPYNAKDTDTRDAAFKSCQQAAVAATILAMLMGGYISELLSYSMIYVIDAAVAIILLVMSLIIFNNSNKVTKAERKKEKGRSAWSFFVKKNMLIFLILYIAPTVFVLGYADYIFPLYSSKAGLSALMLSNLAVFASTISLLASDWVYTLSEELDRKLVLIGSTILFCVCFVMFLVSPNLYWAIAVLFITEVLALAIETPIKEEVAEMSEEEGYEPKATQPIYYTIESGVYVAQSPVISAFMTFGYNLGTALLGIACAAVVGVYGLVTGIFRKD